MKGTETVTSFTDLRSSIVMSLCPNYNCQFFPQTFSFTVLKLFRHFLLLITVILKDQTKATGHVVSWWSTLREKFNLTGPSLLQECLTGEDTRWPVGSTCCTPALPTRGTWGEDWDRSREPPETSCRTGPLTCRLWRRWPHTHTHTIKHHFLVTVS